MARSLALALALLALLLAAPSWFPRAEAQEEVPLESRVEFLELRVDYLTTVSMPPPVEVHPQGVVPAEAFFGPNAFALSCRQGIATTALQHAIGVPWVCVRVVAAAP